MRRLIVALGFLTRLPMPGVAATPSDFAEAARSYPLAGLVVGSIVAGAAWTGGLIDPWIGATTGLVAWIWITGALHLDGLGDVADGLGAAHGDRERLLAVMSDPHIGSFGAVAIASQMIAKLVLLHAIPSGGHLALIVIPAAARLGPLVWAWLLPPLKPTGLGAALASIVRIRDVLGWSLLLAGAAIFVPALIATPFLIAAMLVWLKRSVGGMTGDAHGAGIELVETGLLLAVAVLG